MIATGANVFAQTGTASTSGNSSNPLNGHENNPYSKFGIGELMNGNSAVLRGMGNISTAFENPFEMNTENPASYSFLDRTTFEAGATAGTRTLNAPGVSYTTGTATLSYFSLGFPVNNHAAICFGFKPYSHVFYNMADTIPSGTITSPIGQVARSYNGEGGLNYAYFGGAWRHKGLSIGANLGFMFGTIQNSTASIPIDTAATNRAFSADNTNYNQIGGLYWKAGLMYERKIDSDYTVRFGATLSLSQKLTDRLNSFQISSYNFTDTIVNDTVTNGGEKHGTLKMPLSYSIGVMITRNDKWSLGAEYTTTQWSGYKSSIDSALNAGIGKSAYKISIGGDYTPDINNIRNYFSRVTFRYGIYYGADYVNVDGTQLPVYGLTLGASLPFRRSLSHLHLAADVGRLGTSANNLIQETYFRFTVGLSFNDRWFVKRRYD